VTVDRITVERESVETTPQVGNQVVESETVETTHELSAHDIGAMFDSEDNGSTDGAKEPAQEVGGDPNAAEGDQSEQKDSAGEEGNDAAQDEPKHKIKVRGQEMELPMSEILQLAQQGGDYTQQMQALRERERHVEALSVLGQQLQSDPAFRQYLAAYGQGQGAQQPEQAEQPPADPIERMKWEAKQEARREIEQMLNPQLEQMRSQFEQAQQAQAIQRVQAHVATDPMYKDVQAAIVEQLQALPEAMGRDLYARLDSDPQAYMEMYSRTRASLAARTPQQPQATPPRGADGKFVQQPASKPVQRAVKPPVLATPGADGSQGQSRKQRFADLAARARGGDLNALGAMFD
jgi:hypothetical protein